MFETIYQAHRAYTSGFGDKTPEEVIETLSYVFREMALYVNLSIDDIPDYQKDIYNKYMDLYNEYQLQEEKYIKSLIRRISNV